MDVAILLGNMWVPATCAGGGEGRLVCTVKYSKLAVELNLVSVTLSLPPSRVEIDAPSTRLFQQEREEEEKQCVQGPVVHHAVSKSACSELSSGSSELCYDEEEEKFHSGQVDFELFPECEEAEETAIPRGTFHFSDVVDAIKTACCDLDFPKPVEDLIRLDFLQMDPTFFVSERLNLGFSPFASEIQWSILYRSFEIKNGAKVYNPADYYNSELFPTFKANFDVATHRVAIQCPDSSTVEPPTLPFSMVSSGEDYLIHIYKDVTDPIVLDLLVNWRDDPPPPTATYYSF